MVLNDVYSSSIIHQNLQHGDVLTAEQEFQVLHHKTSTIINDITVCGRRPEIVHIHNELKLSILNILPDIIDLTKLMI